MVPATSRSASAIEPARPLHDDAEISALLAENARLRELVVQLTTIAIKSLVDAEQ
jgi:hypothetical protein